MVRNSTKSVSRVDLAGINQQLLNRFENVIVPTKQTLDSQHKFSNANVMRYKTYLLSNRTRYWVTRRREVPRWLSRLATSRETRLIAHLVTLLFTTNLSLYCTFINCIMAFSLQFYMNYTAGKIKLQRKSQPAVDGGHIYDESACVRCRAMFLLLLRLS